MVNISSPFQDSPSPKDTTPKGPTMPAVTGHDPVLTGYPSD